MRSKVSPVGRWWEATTARVNAKATQELRALPLSRLITLLASQPYCLHLIGVI